MKKIFACGLILFSFFAYSNEIKPTICYSHGECQELIGTELGTRCLIVKTGFDSRGIETCDLRCYTIPMGSYCKRIGDKVYGVCEKESYPVPDFNRDFPDCSRAVEPEF
jgi:hypothetical protein